MKVPGNFPRTYLLLEYYWVTESPSQSLSSQASKNFDKGVYDCDVEENAMRHAVTCRYGHSPGHTREDLGENLYYSTALRMDKLAAAEEATKLWFNELAKFGVGQENVLTNELGYQILHYTQMVWQDTYRLGCFVEWCNSMTYVVCQYGPRGNWNDDPIYEKGNSCTTDDDCNCTNCKCSKEEALCIIQ
ncbi:SCP-like protein [Ancylostoma duodenale]|uniref:SCP-like protein n=1 Tax=Ancylostoma duodenale TaxID=51022 RepID=A0A0C2H1Y1_9BILA|nr:SCP-like protein [Ancylostoma duodenale]